MERYNKLKHGPSAMIEVIQPTGQNGSLIQELSSASSAPSQPPVYPLKGPNFIRCPVPEEARFLLFDQPIQPTDARSLKIGLIGPPNAGKSSLMNRMLGLPIASVSPKVHTTREEIRGVVTNDDTQLVFADCPGVIPVNQSSELKTMVNTAWLTLADCDICLLVLDTLKRPDDRIIALIRKLAGKPTIEEEAQDLMAKKKTRIGEKQSGRAESDESHGILSDKSSTTVHNAPSKPSTPLGAPTNVILVLNKSDSVSDRKWLDARAIELKQHGNFSATFFVSAAQGHGVHRLLAHLRSLALPRPWQYPTSLSSNLSKVDQLEQVVRTFLYCWFNKDLPYKIQQHTVGWTPRLDGSLVIDHELVVKDSVVARMVLGVRNRMLQQLTLKVNERLKLLWGTEVSVKIWVKAKVQRESREDIRKKLEKGFVGGNFKL